jgi:phage anti-repressor protein
MTFHMPERSLSERSVVSAHFQTQQRWYNKKGIMDLGDSKIRQEYVTHVLSLLPPGASSVPRTFLDTFIDKVTAAETSEDQFPISIPELAKWLGVKSTNVRRLLDPHFSRKAAEYVEGHDYVMREGKVRGNSSPRDKYLSVPCMMNLCMRMNSARAGYLRKYFVVIERAYREWFGGAAYARVHGSKRQRSAATASQKVPLFTGKSSRNGASSTRRWATLGT